MILPSATASRRPPGLTSMPKGAGRSFQGASKPFGESARPAWKVLRVLGNLCGVGRFRLHQHLRRCWPKSQATCAQVYNPIIRPEFGPDPSLRCRADGLLRVADVPIYALDSLVRRALVRCKRVRWRVRLLCGCILQWLSELGVAGRDQVQVRQNGCSGRFAAGA
jgi:NADH-quinone oxidoreductase subunit G